MVAPESARMLEPRNASTAPTRNESSPTSGTASSPTCSMCATVAVARKRRGSLAMRSSLTRLSPRKLTSAMISFQLSATAKPRRPMAAAKPYSRLLRGRSSVTSSIAVTSGRWSLRNTIASENEPVRRACRSSWTTPSESRRSTPVASMGHDSRGAERSASAISAAWSRVQLPERRSWSPSTATCGLLLLETVMRGAFPGPCSLRPEDTLPPMDAAAYATRIAFVVELAEHLHAYGTTAQRLEGALIGVATELGLELEPFSNPTGVILSFSDPARPPGDSDTTRVIRLPPGDTDLAKLCEADRIADEVVAGRLDIAAGHAALRALERPPTPRSNLVQVLGFGLVAASIAGLLRLPWLDIGTAGFTGLLIGLLELATRGRPQAREAGEALAALAAGFVAILVATFVGPLNLNTVIIAALIVMVPGMALTNAVNELTSNHLISGTARFAGALATLMKLTVGSGLALALAHFAGIEPQVRAWRPQPDIVEWVSVLLAAFSFAVLFRARWQDYPVVIAAAVSGYLISRLGGQY